MAAAAVVMLRVQISNLCKVAPVGHHGAVEEQRIAVVLVLPQHFANQHLLAAMAAVVKPTAAGAAVREAPAWIAAAQPPSVGFGMANFGPETRRSARRNARPFCLRRRLLGARIGWVCGERTFAFSAFRSFNANSERASLIRRSLQQKTTEEPLSLVTAQDGHHAMTQHERVLFGRQQATCDCRM